MNISGEGIRGVIVPMVTPFTAAGDLDERAALALLEHIGRAGCAPFILGTTGESASISRGVGNQLVRLTVRTRVNGLPVYAGISGNCLKDSISAAERFADWGVDAVVAHLPTYYPLSPEEMFCYYERLVEAVPVPLVLYNIPVTTHSSIPVEVVDRLSFHPRIIGFKDSERDLRRLDQSLLLWAGRTDFSFLVGWARQSAYSLLKGAHGIVPGTGNLVPQLYAALYEAAVHGRAETAFHFQELTDLVSGLYQDDRSIGQSLAALKAVLYGFGLCEPHVLPPLLPVSAEELLDLSDRTSRLKIHELTPGEGIIETGPPPL
jgi:dihydrodipicolinate synthase/N-acetylneuraminate lyase